MCEERRPSFLSEQCVSEEDESDRTAYFPRKEEDIAEGVERGRRRLQGGSGAASDKASEEAGIAREDITEEEWVKEKTMMTGTIRSKGPPLNEAVEHIRNGGCCPLRCHMSDSVDGGECHSVEHPLISGDLPVDFPWRPLLDCLPSEIINPVHSAYVSLLTYLVSQRLHLYPLRRIRSVVLLP